ncbi:plant invertase/pectin methylesterase inhibitor superfamily protein [Actinidia rufa]|uniref:Plant invertase/pectin methylesterase inhibitor superfamily protein n=1 Tax=Actinidia rufa TaxID=165716 RepID=A0A7J0E6R6_9ERIC|nr:plant invertase/pectin methylesterase inhibitor superfamily protein [Actinidia rufa]
MESSSYFLTALLILLSYINSSSVARETSTEFIKTSCSTTTYPTLCYSSLSTHASAIQTSPRLLAHTALSVTLDNTQSTSAMISRLSQSHGMSPREVTAMLDCVEELSDSVDQLRRSVAEMNQLKGSNFALMMNDIQTWVSAALTNEDTCTDGFAETTVSSNVKNVVRGWIVNIAHMTSNALALINSFASVHG